MSYNKQVTVNELLKQNAEQALAFQRDDGSFPPGRNYGYDETETPVRTTSNWLRVLLAGYRITGQERYRDAAMAATDFLLGDSCRPHGETFYCRKIDDKDKCNGLVGQATAIRALVAAGLTLERDDAIEIACSVFKLHPFDGDIKIWQRIEITGENLSFDRTLNHQIIFAESAVGLVSKDERIDLQLRRFLDGLLTNLRTHKNGLIRHYARPNPVTAIQSTLQNPSYWNLLVNEVAFHYKSRSKKHRRKEIGYHPINLQSLGVLKEHYPDHRLWDHETITAALNYAQSELYLANMYSVKSGSTIPGIHTAHALSNLTTVSENSLRTLIESDLKRKLDLETWLLTSDSIDQFDQVTSISALIGFPNFELTI